MKRNEERERLVAEAMRLEAFLYRIHEFFWFRPERGGSFRAVACVNEPSIMCVLAGVGLGIVDADSFADQDRAVPESENTNRPKAELSRPRDGISSVVPDFSGSYYDAVAARRRKYVRMLGFVLFFVAALYYIISDILHPVGEVSM